ncbi:MAG TPA: hypothetical protein VFH78_01665 [Candidatus Thermoplasmatota archaeon]|nr:hypothetical protein [Candidatus Thermoplasmatota archaeon]
MKLAGRTLIALALVALLTGSATATWYSFGTFEPDTSYDSEAWMWQEPPQPGQQRVYFNVLTTGFSATPSGRPAANPNVGLLHMQVETVTLERHAGYLGVWVDCNGDGYIGMAESGAREYSALLLLSESTCPAASGGTSAWTAGAHNYNGWVTEFIPIVMDKPMTDARHYLDPEARVWGDFHRPDEKPYQRSCPTRPFPRGTLETTGGALSYLDCRTDILGIWNDAVDLVGDPLGLRFADPDEGRSGPLGQRWLFGPESTDHAAVRTVDCSDPVTRVGPLWVRTPKPTLGPAATNPTSLTFVGQLNQTSEEWLDDCDTSNDYGHDFYNSFELDFNSVNPKNKTQANWNFELDVAARGGTPFLVVGAGTAGIPQDGGLGIGGTRWVSDSTYTKTGPRTVRVDLDNGGAQADRAYWLTFYARVGSATLGRGFDFAATPATYGSWHCGSSTSGIHNGWNCDPAVWYINPDGSFHPQKSRLAHPGWTYHARDVDCYDGGIGALGVGAGAAYYGNEPCTNAGP